MVELIKATTEEIQKELARRDAEASQRIVETAAALGKLDTMRAEGKIDCARCTTLRTELEIGRYQQAILVVLKG